MSSKLKKALIIAIAAFISYLSGYTIAPAALESLCLKLGFCEVSE